MESEINKLVSDFESGTLSRRDLVRGMTVLSATAAAGILLGVSEDASAHEECKCAEPVMDDSDLSKCTTANPDVAHHLVERLINSRFSRSGRQVYICTGADAEVFKSADDHADWLFAGDDSFIKLRDNVANSGCISKKFEDHDGKLDSDTTAQRPHIKAILEKANQNGFKIFEENDQLLYRALRAKIKAEQDSHSRSAIECFAAWLDGKDTPDGPVVPNHAGAICAKHVCDGDQHNGEPYTYNHCYMEYCKIPPETSHQWY